MLSKSKRVKAAFALAVIASVVILYLLLRRLEWSLLLKELTRVSLPGAVLCGALVVCTFLIRAIRWRYLLPSDTRVSTLKLLESCFVGNLATFVLPFRAGEFVRPLMLSRLSNVSFAAGFASIVAERVFDVAAILCFLWISLSRIPSVPVMVTAGAKAVGVIAILTILLMVSAYLFERQFEALARKIQSQGLGGRFGNKLSDMALEFVGGLKAISSFKELLLAVFLSALHWLVMAASFQAALWMMGAYPPFGVGILAMVGVALAVAAPSAPGFVGTFQLGCVVILSGLFSYSEEFAFAYSLLLHGIHYLLVVSIGFLILYFEGLRLRELSH